VFFFSVGFVGLCFYHFFVEEGLEFLTFFLLIYVVLKK